MAFNCKMHERNIYKSRPDFAQIAKDFPLFRKYAIPNAKGKVYVNFSDTEALRALSTILLKKDFGLDIEIPPGYLIPTVPQRLNYILWIEDLLANIPQLNENISGIDIGTGPCAVFSLLGARKNGWNFTATESSHDAFEWANKNIQKNNLASKINVVSVNQNTTLSEVLSSDEKCYEFCLCNPPFFETQEEIRNKHSNFTKTVADVAQTCEIFFKGGEVEFVRSIIKDSLAFKKRICIFSSMFGKKASFQQIHKELLEIQDLKVAVTEFCQGNTVRWGIAWSYDDSVQFQNSEFIFSRARKKQKIKKAKQPLEFCIPVLKEEIFMMDALSNKVKKFLNDLKITVIPVKNTKTYAELLLKSDMCTWTHQRRRRRELERQKRQLNTSKGSSAKSGGPFGCHPSSDLIDSESMESAGQSPTFTSEDTNINDCGVLICKKISESNDLFMHDKLETQKTTETYIINETKSEQNSNCNPTEQLNCRKRQLSSDEEELLKMKKSKLDKDEVIQGTVLNCKLQLIKGKNKIYVKMNCSLDVDRNVMYQVFQILKNKLN